VNENTYSRLDQKPYDTHYMLAETIIPHPLEEVWPHALNIGAWMSAHRLESLSGTTGSVGHFERVYPRDLPAETKTPLYHLYGVAHVIPLKYIALEVLPEKGGSYGNYREWMSFDGILLTRLPDITTHLTFLLVDVHLGKGDHESYEKTRKELDDARPLLDQYFENLKRLVQKDRTS
jgi:hypothetical protein